MSYQQFSLALRSHTRAAFEAAIAAIPEDEALTVADIGCAEGALVTALALARPRASFTAVSADFRDLAQAIALSRAFGATNVAHVSGLGGDVQYDVTLWLTTCHHMIGALGPERAGQVLRARTRRAAVVLLPMGSDGVLEIWRAHGDDLDVLACAGSAREWLLRHFDDVDTGTPVVFDGNPDLLRRAFVCRVAPPRR